MALVKDHSVSNIGQGPLSSSLMGYGSDGLVTHAAQVLAL
jgi:hypothetical protein